MRLLYNLLLFILVIDQYNLQSIDNDNSKRSISAKNEAKLEQFLSEEYEPKVDAISHKQVVAEWNHLVDITNKEKEDILVNTTLEYAKFNQRYWADYFTHLNPDDFTDETLRRKLRKLSILGNIALNTELLTEFTTILNNMTTIYSTARICPYTNKTCNLTLEGYQLEPDIENIMSKSNNYEELKYIWVSWRDATGAKMRTQYERYVELSNMAAKENGFSNKATMWQFEFETRSFSGLMTRLWDRIEPIYNDLHKYVYYKLKHSYVEMENSTDELIPAHLLGNMWGQSWTSLSELVKPFPNASRVDVTAALKEQNYTVLKMFQIADEFYTSLGLKTNEMSFSQKAMIVKPNDREVLCHASAWDFITGNDFRIKMCTDINFEDFVTIHHEMGHIQYYIQYHHLPSSFRSGANPGFHEAIGDTIALSVTTPEHLQKIGLLQNYQENEQTSINALMDMALERLAFLPFGLIIDKWRWDVFAGRVNSKGWNTHWWHYRETIQKIKAPVERSDEDFDPGAKYHVPADSQYISYFFAHILEFQLHRALCMAAGRYEFGQLHKCDIYKSRLAGDKLRAGMALGASEHWSIVLKRMTKQKKLSAAALLEYFRPLHVWLKKENVKYSGKTEKKGR